ncbi:MAG: DUF211 domain-containing protein [Promethearchaeota archaeon]
MSYGIKRFVLDVLKPHNPPLHALAEKIARLEGVSGVNICLIEVDSETESVKITIVGPDLNFDLIKQQLEELGGSIHSVDQVVAGQKIVEEAETHQ